MNAAKNSKSLKGLGSLNFWRAQEGKLFAALLSEGMVGEPLVFAVTLRT